MSIVWTGLAPHPPIIVDSVGGARCGEVRTTIESMTALARDFLEARPDRLILISPHTPRPRLGIGAWTGASIHGNFGRFGAPQARVELPVDQSWMKGFEKSYPRLLDLGLEALDHGATVPLYFLTQAGWDGPTCVLGLPWSEEDELDVIGRAIASVQVDSRRTAILASGDMSHCLLHEGPYGYDERGPSFDKIFVEHIQNSHYRDVLDIDPGLKEGARQDVVESCRIAWNASGYRSDGHHFYSYEGPFGVGYSVMKFYGAAS